MHDENNPTYRPQRRHCDCRRHGRHPGHRPRARFAQGTTVHWIRWNDFVPASDQLLRRELHSRGEKTLGIKINLETVNGNDLQPRITAAIQSGPVPTSSCCSTTTRSFMPQASRT
jgi:multiple sugar transport system substrate-binding protein